MFHGPREEYCSVDVTAQASFSGLSSRVFKAPTSVAPAIDLQTVRVINGNGAALPMAPITNLTTATTGNTYIPNYFYSFANGICNSTSGRTRYRSFATSASWGAARSPLAGVEPFQPAK